jgi:hypothetical protein
MLAGTSQNMTLITKARSHQAHKGKLFPLCLFVSWRLCGEIALAVQDPDWQDTRASIPQHLHLRRSAAQVQVSALRDPQ